MAVTGAADPVGVVRSYLDAFAGRDPDAIAAHVDADFANDHRSTLGVSCRGRDEYRRRLPGFLAAFPGLRYEVIDLLAGGDRVVVAYTMHAALAAGPLAVPGVMWFDVHDGLITRRVDLFDAGAVPPHAERERQRPRPPTPPPTIWGRSVHHRDLGEVCCGPATDPPGWARHRFGAMTARDHIVDPAIAAYVTGHSTAPDRVQQALIDTTYERTGNRAGMQIGSDQGTFFEILVRAMGVTDAIEIGTFTGYSALAIARGLAPGGRLICCDVSEEWTAIGRAAWADAGVADRIDLRIAPALDTIAALGDDDQFDLAFIDADKPAYAAYVDALLPRVRPSGVILIDNTLWSGRVLADPSDDDDENTIALRALNDALGVTAGPVGRRAPHRRWRHDDPTPPLTQHAPRSGDDPSAHPIWGESVADSATGFPQMIAHTNLPQIVGVSGGEAVGGFDGAGEAGVDAEREVLDVEAIGRLLSVEIAGVDALEDADRLPGVEAAVVVELAEVGAGAVGVPLDQRLTGTEPLERSGRVTGDALVARARPRR